MPLQAEQDLDLLTTTLNELGEHKWTDDISSIVDFIGLNHIFKKEKVTFQAGPQIRFNVAVTPSTAFRMVGMIGVTDNVNVIDHMTTGLIPWRRGNTNWGIDATEISMNRSPRQLIDLTKERRSVAMIGLAEGLETQVWSQPADSNDKLNSYGVPTWLVPNATAASAQGDFNGLNPYGFSTGIALDSTVYSKWANYTDSYKVIDKLDLVRKLRRAAYLTDFKSPVEAQVPSYSTGMRRGIYTTYLVSQRLEEIAEQQNDNLGNDVASKDGLSTFKRTPITPVPKLDVLSGTGAAGATGSFVNATYTSSGGMPVNPVYMIDWGVFHVAFLGGWYMREHGPYIVPGQSTTYATQVHFVWNMICRDRRRQSVFTM